MKLCVKKIPMDMAVSGMMLAAAVCNERGDVLLQSGCELSDSSLSSLRRRGILHVAILDEESRSEEELEALRNVARNRLGVLFRNAGADAHLASLHNLILEYRLERLA